MYLVASACLLCCKEVITTCSNYTKRSTRCRVNKPGSLVTSNETLQSGGVNTIEQLYFGEARPRSQPGRLGQTVSTEVFRVKKKYRRN
jgi:hypothetical protein